MPVFDIIASALIALPPAAAGAIPPAQPIDALAAETPSPAELEQIQAQRDRYERMTVPVTIEGEGPYRFLIDTGAQATVVTSRIVDDLQLVPSGRAMLVALGSRAMVETVDIDGLEFANRRHSGLTAPLLRDRDIGADGILGLDTLQGMRVLIDFRRDRMVVADAAELGGNLGFEIIVRARRKLGQMIITDAKVNGVRTAVIIDTGAQNSVGNMALRKRLRMREDGKMLATDVHGTEVVSNMVMARELTIGGITLKGVPIGYNESPAFAALGLTGKPALILGMGNLRPFERVAIDFATRRILFDVPGGNARNGTPDKVFFPSRIGAN